MTVICQLHEARWMLPVSYMGQVCGYLSVSLGRMTVICQLHGVGYQCLSVTSGRMTVFCQLHEAG